MADIADLASAREAEILADALAAQSLRYSNQAPALLWCEECGEGIPLQRRLAMPGARRCIKCQSDFEQKEQRGLV